MRERWQPWWVLVVCAVALGFTVLVLGVVKGIS